MNVGAETEDRIVPAQGTETCFRCAESGSISTRRHNTNTYIPSFEIQGKEAVELARQYLAPIMLKSGFLTNPTTGEITEKGDDRAIAQIYMAVLTEMWKEFKSVSDGSYLAAHYPNTYKRLDEPKAESLEKYKFHYRGPVIKTTTATLSDANGGKNHNYKKLNAEGTSDKGRYSAQKAWQRQALEGGSSTLVPQTDGPLNGRIESSTNMAGNYAHQPQASGGGNTVYKLPPNERQNTCSYVSPDAANQEGSITPEGEDMDGLNADADCDNDEAIEAARLVLDAECAAEMDNDVNFKCEPYPDQLVTCVIPGENDKLPTQMFSNNDPEDNVMGSGSAVYPTVGLLAALLVSSVFN